MNRERTKTKLAISERAVSPVGIIFRLIVNALPSRRSFLRQTKDIDARYSRAQGINYLNSASHFKLEYLA